MPVRGPTSRASPVDIAGFFVPLKTTVPPPAFTIVSCETRESRPMETGAVTEEVLSVIVAAVSPGSPAERAGLRRGDIITRVDDEPIAGGGDLRRALRDRSPGTEVTLSVQRGSERVTTRVRLVDAPGT